MPQIDASIISGLKTPSVDPLELAGKAQGLQSAVLNNRLLGQQVRGKEALGKLIGANTDQETGDVNWSGVGVGASKNPDASLLMPEIQKSNLDRQIAELKKKGEQAGLTATNQKLIAAGMIPFLQQHMAKGAPPPTIEDFERAATETLTQMGPAADENVKAAVSAAVQQARNNPKMILPIAQGAVLRGMPNAETLGMIMGPMAHGGLSASEATTPTPAMVRGPDGNLVQSAITREQFVDQSKGGPIATAAPLSRSGMSAQDLARTVTIIDPETKEPKIVTLGSLLGEEVGSGAAPAAAQPSGKAPNGRYSGASAPAIKGGGVATGMAPGEAEAMAASATQSAGAYQKDVQEAGGYAQRIQGLSKAYEALQKAETGPGTKGLQNYRAIFDSFGIRTAGGKEKVESYAEAQKYLQDYANQRGAGLGLGTDAARGLVQAANPGVQTPKGAALQVLNTIKGLERMQAAQVAAAQAEGVTADKYADWRAKWNRSVDPAAFAPPKLDKAGWEAKRKTMGDKWPAYAKGLNAALAAGVISAADLRK